MRVMQMDWIMIGLNGDSTPEYDAVEEPEMPATWWTVQHHTDTASLLGVHRRCGTIVASCYTIELDIHHF